MPHKKSVPKLEDLSLFVTVRQVQLIKNVVILHTFEKHWLNYENKEHVKYLPIPSLLWQEIFKKLHDSNSLNYYNIQMFLTEGTKCLHLLNVLNVNIILSLSYCRYLEDLNLAGCYCVSALTLKHLIESLKYLTSLNLVATCCDDEVTISILSSCKRLKYLNISETVVTDKAFQNFDSYSNLPCCQDLITLKLSGARISSLGLLKALRIFPNLCSLDPLHPNIFKALALRSEPCILKLEEVSFLFTVADDYLNCLRYVCPFLKKVGIIMTGCNLSNALTLSRLNCLLELDLNLIFSSKIRKEDVSQFLENVGQKALKITISFWDLNLYEIIKYCKIVEYLSLNLKTCCFIKEKNYSLSALKNLQSLNLWISIKSEETRASTRTFLKYCGNVNCMCLVATPSIDDMFLNELLNQNMCYQIRNLTLDNLHGITLCGVKQILTNHNNELTYLNIYGCHEIKEKDYKNFLNIAKKLNLDIKIKYFEF